MRKVFLLAAVLLMMPFAARADTSISRVDSKQFPLAMFAVPGTDAVFAQVKAMGIDYVHIYGIAAGTVSENLYKRNQDYLDLAQKHHLKVMFDLDGSRRVPAKELDEMRKVVHHFKDHPALGSWYLYDEPNLRKDSSPADLLPFYKMIKEETPNIPVCVTMSVSSKKPGLDYMWNDFGDDYDILSFDTYPVRGEKFPDARLNRVSDSTVLQSLNNTKLKPWKFTRADVLRMENNKVAAIDVQPWGVAVWEVQ